MKDSRTLFTSEGVHFSIYLYIVQLDLVFIYL